MTGQGVSVRFRVLSRHTTAGPDWSAARTFFSDLMHPRAIEAAVRDAFEHSTTVATTGDRVLLSGEGSGYLIEMVFNRTTNVIETAYPVVR